MTQPTLPLLSLTARRMGRGLFALLLTLTVVHAAPSAFPETNLTFGVGFPLGILVSGEVYLPVEFLDVSVGLDGALPVAGVEEASVRLFGSALVFPALGTTPPLALGLGIDAGYGPQGVSVHTGPTFGSDLLFTLNLPMVVSLYVAPGYGSNVGFSLAWSGQVRYYFDDVAVELSSSDQSLVALNLRVLF